MGATRRDVGGAVRLANLFGVLGWHAVVGVVCLARGRRGFEALMLEPLRWAVVIMLAASVIVMVELVFRRPGANPVEPLRSALAFGFVVSATWGWGWVFWAARGAGYDALAAWFSRGWGGGFDAETGSGFAGVPGPALAAVAGLTALAATTEHYGELWRRDGSGDSTNSDSTNSDPNDNHTNDPNHNNHTNEPTTTRLSPIGVSAIVLTLLAVGGVLHLATGAQLNLRAWS